MPNNNGISVYPSDETLNQLQEQCGENQSMSETAEEFIKAGIRARNARFADWIYWELAKVSGIFGLLLLMITAVSDGGAPPFNPVYVSFVFIAASFVFMAADRYEFSVTGTLAGGDRADEEPTRG